jgi:hypothetical protein
MNDQRPPFERGVNSLGLMFQSYVLSFLFRSTDMNLKKGLMIHLVLMFSLLSKFGHTQESQLNCGEYIRFMTSYATPPYANEKAIENLGGTSGMRLRKLQQEFIRSSREDPSSPWSQSENPRNSEIDFWESPSRASAEAFDRLRLESVSMGRDCLTEMRQMQNRSDIDPDVKVRMRELLRSVEQVCPEAEIWSETSRRCMPRPAPVAEERACGSIDGVMRGWRCMCRSEDEAPALESSVEFLAQRNIPCREQRVARLRKIRCGKRRQIWNDQRNQCVDPPTAISAGGSAPDSSTATPALRQSSSPVR